MSLDKITTKLQEALADAQSLAVGNDNQYIEPVHVLSALLKQDDGGARSLLQRAGVNVNALSNALPGALARLPKVSGTGGDIKPGRELIALLNLADREAQKRGDEFIASEMVLLALADDKSEAGRLARENGLERKALEAAIDGGARRCRRVVGGRRRPARGAEEIHARSDRARAPRQARPGDRARRRNPARDPGPAAAHQEQPGPDRRTGRRQDRDRRGPGAAHREWRSAGFAEGQARAVARHGGAAGRRQVSRRVRGTPEGGAARTGAGRRADHRLHRRTAYHGRRRQGRRRDGRRQHAEAGAGARRAALRRRHHARRIPQVHRKGRGAGAALPENPGRRAERRGDHCDPARAAGKIRGAPQGRDHRPGDRRCGRAVATATSPAASCRTRRST